MSNFSEVVAGLSLITLSVGFIIAVIIIGPLLTIWALNVIFPVLAIGYSFDRILTPYPVTQLKTEDLHFLSN